jgi:hypothetical protein
MYTDWWEIHTESSLKCSIQANTALEDIIHHRSSTDTLLKFLIKASCGGCPPEDDLWRMYTDWWEIHTDTCLKHIIQAEIHTEDIISHRSSTGTPLKFLIKASCGGCPPEDDLWRMYRCWWEIHQNRTISSTDSRERGRPKAVSSAQKALRSQAKDIQ